MGKLRLNEEILWFLGGCFIIGKRGVAGVRLDFQPVLRLSWLVRGRA